MVARDVASHVWQYPSISLERVDARRLRGMRGTCCTGMESFPSSLAATSASRTSNLPHARRRMWPADGMRVVAGGSPEGTVK
jgi:hypothetical protein